MEDEIYMIGGFTGWRKEFIENVPNVNFDNPINNNQSSIARLITDDMGAASIKSSLAYIEKNKRLGTMSYAELGTARAAGKPIISVDENEIKDSILEHICSYDFQTKEDCYKFLSDNPKLISKYNPIQKINKTKSKEPCKNVLLCGFDRLPEIENSNMFLTQDKMRYAIEDFSKENDLLVVNFDKGKKHSPEGLFLMGLAYKTEIPIVLLEGNEIPYPPLVGLARRVMVGKNRFNHLNEYLTNLKSQHIEDESMVYYNLMKKFNK
ncbi:MAG TPA: hypothetical protein VJ895_00850 [Candidatus Nanoarchaeia archaeon]|nr:hypothetical protein [Candidatus Nanoarchaeia archaeon]